MKDTAYIDTTPKYVRDCAHCGEKFATPHHLVKLCSTECAQERQRQQQQAWRHANRVNHPPKPCTECGTSFIPRSSQTMTCSEACSYRRAKHLAKLRRAYHKRERGHWDEALKILKHEVKTLSQISSDSSAASAEELQNKYCAAADRFKRCIADTQKLIKQYEESNV